MKCYSPYLNKVETKWWSICHSIVVIKVVIRLWKFVEIICHSIVVMKYLERVVKVYDVWWMKCLSLNCCDEELFHRLLNEVWNECWNKCCDEDLHSMKCLLARFSKIMWWIEDVLKMCWRSISSLLKVCNVCMNFIRSFLKNNSMKMWSVILHIWNEVMNNPSLNMLWWSIYHLNFVIKSLWMFVMKYITHLDICEEFVEASIT